MEAGPDAGTERDCVRPMGRKDGRAQEPAVEIPAGVKKGPFVYVTFYDIGVVREVPFMSKLRCLIVWIFSGFDFVHCNVVYKNSVYDVGRDGPAIKRMASVPLPATSFKYFVRPDCSDFVEKRRYSDWRSLASFFWLPVDRRRVVNCVQSTLRMLRLQDKKCRTPSDVFRLMREVA